MRKILIFTLVAIALTGCVLTTSRGGREIGYIVDAEEHGWLFHNYYIQVKNSDQQSAREEYCIPYANRDLFNKAQRLVESQKKVVVKYRGVNNILAIGQCDAYIAESIEEVKQ